MTSVNSISTFPADDKNVQSVCEGKACVLLPQSVFYNKVQEFNRDLTIAVIQNFVLKHSELSDEQMDKLSKRDKRNMVSSDAAAVDAKTKESQAGTTGMTTTTSEADTPSKTNCKMSGKGIRILEGLAASGLRSVRFALEIPGIREVVANDFDQTAVEFIKHNAETNGVASLVIPSCADAAMVMYLNRLHSNRFDVIDLDPYGSPAKFLDSAVQSVADGGLLCVTCTDMAVLCGNSPETCLSKYGAVSLRAPFCHELALRILLQSIASHAARYQRYIEPVLSLSVDFYIRVFVRVYTSQSRVKDVATKLSSLYHCRHCGAFTLQPLMGKNGNAYVAATGPPVGPQCEICGGRHVIAGPIWSAPIHNTDFARQVFENVSNDSALFPSTRDRIMGTLGVILEELAECPLYYVSDDLCSVLHCVSPGFLPLRSALLNAGYQVSLSHAKKNSIKTNAPVNVIWDIMRCWVRNHPVSEQRLQEGSAAKSILSKPAVVEADFSLHPDANPASRSRGLVRWQMNPDRDWGPKARATRSSPAENVADRRLKGEVKAESCRKKRKMNHNLKNFPCKKLLGGTCDLGEECRYSHDVNAVAAGDAGSNELDG